MTVHTQAARRLVSHVPPSPITLCACRRAKSSPRGATSSTVSATSLSPSGSTMTTLYGPIRISSPGLTVVEPTTAPLTRSGLVPAWLRNSAPSASRNCSVASFRPTRMSCSSTSELAARPNRSMSALIWVGLSDTPPRGRRVTWLT